MQIPHPENPLPQPGLDSFERFHGKVAGIRSLLIGGRHPEAELRALQTHRETEALQEQELLSAREHAVRMAVVGIYMGISRWHQEGKDGFHVLSDGMRIIQRSADAFPTRGPEESHREIEGVLALIDAQKVMYKIRPPRSPKDKIQLFLDDREVLKYAEWVREQVREHHVSAFTEHILQSQLTDLRLTVAADALEVPLCPDAAAAIAGIDPHELEFYQGSWLADIRERIGELADREAD